MELEGTRVLLTGASGGIGAELAAALGARGARLALLGRDRGALDQLASKLGSSGCHAIAVPVDLLRAVERSKAVERACAALGGVDVLVNNAGLLSFRPFAEEDPAVIERILQLNAMTPVLLTRQVLPRMLDQGSGRVVNIGSTFGAVGFPWFAAYSASKYCLRGFSEALRRELHGTGVGVTYVAPRAVKTRLNTEAVYRMAKATGMNMDAPEWVAARVVRALEAGSADIHLGFPEALIVRLNALLPRLMDRALRRHTRVMARFAQES